MGKIEIFDSERAIAEQIQNSCVLAYCVQVKPASQAVNNKTLAIAASNALKSYSNVQIPECDELYTTESVLASTVWNRNDEIFTKEDSWAARHTPRNKPTNLGHIEYKVVGHMVDTWVVDQDSQLIPDDTPVNKLPDLFHICNSAVIYRHWQDEELQERVDKLIASIEAGETYVSMECLLSAFDYGMLDSRGQLTVVKREKSTAWLSKYLRCYNGTGVYEGSQIGRIPRGFVFSGKGYVKKPANPDSVIFSHSNLINFSKANEQILLDKNAGVSLSYEENQKLIANEKNTMEKQMDEMEKMKQQLAQAQEAVKTSEAARAELANQLVKIEAAKFETQITDLNAKLEVAVKASDETKQNLDSVTAELAKAKADLDKVVAEKAELEQAIAKAEAEKIVAGRISTLVEGGIDKADAEAQVAVFANLNDEQFKVIAETLVVAAKAKKKPAEMPAEQAKCSEADDAEAALETAKANEEAVVNNGVTEAAEVQQIRVKLSAALLGS